MTYRLFIDSAKPQEWDLARARGWLHGVTTNPLIIQRAGLRVELATARDLVEAAKERALAEIQLQVTGHGAEEMLASGRALRALWGHVTVKVPATAAGFAAATQLIRDGAHVTITACYSAQQTMLAAAIGARYVAPYYARMLDAGLDADERLDAMQRIAGQQQNLSVLVASIRSVDQLETLARRGFDTFTLSAPIAAAFGQTAESDAAAADFMKAAEDSLKS
ncbi:transaldolase [Dongia mobilis]|uniref:Transaldolase n=1 Tax=Dongia mobilis TaxID=578943 RepID=A0A4R6WVH2_9PROT|nr:transaldolase family protein [Dongia mobilis]TDQ84439.1 transaldolase [Dongia mobilis]